MGAQSNALEYAYRYSTNTRLNVTAGKSRLEDLDYGQAVSEQKKEADPAAICIFYAEKTDGTENPRGGKFSCLISGGERRSEGFRAFLRRFFAYSRRKNKYFKKSLTRHLLLCYHIRCTIVVHWAYCALFALYAAGCDLYRIL